MPYSKKHGQFHLELLGSPSPSAENMRVGPLRALRGNRVLYTDPFDVTCCSSLLYIAVFTGSHPIVDMYPARAYMRRRGAVRRKPRTFHTSFHRDTNPAVHKCGSCSQIIYAFAAVIKFIECVTSIGFVRD